MQHRAGPARTTSRGSLLLAGALLALAWTCSSSTTEGDVWPELPGSVGGGGPGAGGMGGGGTGGSVASGGGQGGDATGGAGGTGGGTGGGGGVCDDPGPGEPNDTEATALFLGIITDSDGDGGVFSGVLADGNDADWFSYNGVDTFGSEVDPTRDNFTSGQFRLCLFAECVNGSTLDLECIDGSTAATSPGGRPGCCKMGPFSLSTFDCTSSDDDTRVYIRIDQPASTCLAYSVTYHY